MKEKLKKKVYKKGLIVTNDKKSHYYKFYNPKLQKVKVVINTSINGGGNNGGNGGADSGGGG